MPTFPSLPLQLVRLGAEGLLPGLQSHQIHQPCGWDVALNPHTCHGASISTDPAQSECWIPHTASSERRCSFLAPVGGQWVPFSPSCCQPADVSPFPGTRAGLSHVEGGGAEQKLEV